MFRPGNVTDWQSIDISLGSLIKFPALKLPDNKDPTIFSGFKFNSDALGGVNITLNLI